MVMFTRSSRDSLLLASRISMPTMCLFSSRSTVTPSSMSILSSTGASLNWIYKASASLSYSILKANHLRLFRFLTAEITRKLSSSSLYVTLRNFPDVSTHAFNLPSTEGSRCSGFCIVDPTSVSVILWSRILFLARLVYLTGFIKKIISDAFSTCKRSLISRLVLSVPLVNLDQNLFLKKMDQNRSHGDDSLGVGSREVRGGSRPITASPCLRFYFWSGTRHSTRYTLHPDIFYAMRLDLCAMPF